MKYILLDNFNDNLNIVCKPDESGEHLVFDSLKEAKEALPEYCQNGQIIPLNTDLIYIIEELHNSNNEGTEAIHIDDLVSDILNLS